MKHIASLLATILLATQSFGAISFAHASGLSANSAYPSDDLRPSTNAQPVEYIIKLKSTRTKTLGGHANGDEAAQLLTQLRAVAGVPVRYARALSGAAHLITLNPDDAGAVNHFIANQDALGIQYIVPNLRRYTALTPDDPQFEKQAHYQSVSDANYSANLTAAWDLVKGSQDIVVAVIDTGIRPDHPDLVGRWLEGYDFVSNAAIANDGDGRDPDPSDPGDWVTFEEARISSSFFYGCSATDSIWHGTHVAGLIGAAGNNQTGVAGANWYSKILPVRVMGKCGGNDADIIDGIRWAVGLPVPGAPINKHPAQVLNLSLGGWGVCNDAYQSAINDAVGTGAIVVVAAGNARSNAENFIPANCQNVIAVGATTKMGNRASYSNYGKNIIISAPGGDSFVDPDDSILSTVDTGKTIPIAPGYKSYNGTSMATAEVSGIVSLMLSAKPKMSLHDVRIALHFSATPFPIGSTCDKSLCGAGIVNASAAISMVAQSRMTSIFVPAMTYLHGNVEPEAIPLPNGGFEQGPTVARGWRGWVA